MGLFGKLILKLTGGDTGERPAKATTAQAPPRDVQVTFSLSYPRRSETRVHVSDEEVAESAGKYSFVLTNEPPPLKATDQWWSEENGDYEHGKFVWADMLDAAPDAEVGHEPSRVIDAWLAFNAWLWPSALRLTMTTTYLVEERNGRTISSNTRKVRCMEAGRKRGNGLEEGPVRRRPW